MPDSGRLEGSVVRVETAAGEVLGAGFIASPRHVLTCAHVVREPGSELRLTFLGAPRVDPAAAVSLTDHFGDPDGEATDVAVLELRTELPSGVAPAAVYRHLLGGRFHAVGFPAGAAKGASVAGDVLAPDLGGWVQLETDSELGVDPGFSGTLVWSEAQKAAVGMVVARRGERVAYMIPVEALARFWPALRVTTGVVAIGEGAAGARPQRLRLGWRELAGDDVLGWLHWRTRLVEELVGREREMESLLGWAESGPRVRARILAGEGGVGKSRFAAELAERLRERGWLAGFGAAAEAQLYPACLAGTLVLLDYPEEQLEAVRRILADLDRVGAESPLRLLLVSRQAEALWQREIDDAGAFAVFDERPMVLEPLSPPETYELFRLAQRSAPREAEPRATSEDEFLAWARRAPAHQRPLFVLAAAVESVLRPRRKVVGLSGSEVVQSLARRELRRLRQESRAAGMEAESLPALTAIAAVAGGLDGSALRELARRGAELGLDLPEPERVVQRLRRTGRLAGSHLPAPAPDIVAAALLVEVLRGDDELAPERIWAGVGKEVAGGLSRIGRLAYDAEETLGLLEHRPSEWLRRALAERPGRCKEAESVFYEANLPPALAKAADAVWQAALAGGGDEARRATLLNNRAVDLTAAGRRPEALAASEEAVEIRRRLAAASPERYEPELALSLNNLSNALSDAGRRPEALAAIEEAVAIRRRLAAASPERYEPDLAGSLHNLSARLSDAGPRPEALAAIEEAVAIWRRLAAASPERYEPDLALSLNNLSNRLSDARSRPEALAAIEEAVAIWRRLAAASPERYEPDLALSLNNLSNALSDAGRRPEALAASEEAVTLLKPYAEQFPGSAFEQWLEIAIRNRSRLASG